MEEKKDCPCPKKNCPRHGKCDECRSYHAEHKKHPPYCEREKQKAGKPDERQARRSLRRQ
ncbi:MAG: hypothetical protein CVU91_00190 [Firmicutes bacterium HGW-Firmicutes-16]|nr:MAG: hypothetical protein CVU91_00190 [Firmicutes bacterium HGW-Firmicutes-16]